ncbi:ATP-dependent helicase, partial [candidate division WOR-3 bacterium]|nr:ATP-dependent helicase [candidate division WOR-3 bacterium]
MWMSVARSRPARIIIMLTHLASFVSVATEVGFAASPVFCGAAGLSARRLFFSFTCSPSASNLRLRLVTWMCAHESTCAATSLAVTRGYSESSRCQSPRPGVGRERSRGLESSPTVPSPVGADSHPRQNRSRGLESSPTRLYTWLMAELPAWLSGLNPQQLAAVTHGDGPLLIIAGAGTGKTNTLAHRVAWLIHQGVQPGRILLLTFTRRAAQEMLNRAQAVCKHATSKVWSGTFHSLANRLLRIYGRVAGLQPDFTVMDESDSADMLGLIRAQLNLASKDKRFPRKATIRAIYSRVVNSREPLAAVLKKEYPWCVEAEDGVRAIFNAYTQRKQQRQVLDYDDLLLFWNHALGDASMAETMSARFDHILVDEYQDTNLIQAEILQRLRQKNRNITVVGDDAQSIYSFRAATVKN